MASVDDIRDQLRSLGLESRGNRATLKERLRKYLKLHPEIKRSLSGQGSDNDSEEDENGQGSGKDLKGGDSHSSTIQTVRDINKSEQEIGDDTSHGSDRTASGALSKELHQNSRYDYYLCFDVEATCEKGFSFEFPNEVIEFPVVLLDGSTLEVVDEFQSYVRPTYRPTLSEFCVELTGIQQETIDAAPTFTEMLILFDEWLTKHGIILGEHPLAHLGQCTKEKTQKNRSNKQQKHPSKTRSRPSNNKKGRNPHQETSTFGSPEPQHGPTALNDFVYGATFCFVCDGPFDIRDFIQKQCIHSDILRPSYFAKPFLDIRTLFRDYFGLIHWLNLEGMLRFLGETFQGRQHSGICDARMVALIAKRLAHGFKSLPKSVRSIQEAKNKKAKRVSQSGGGDSTHTPTNKDPNVQQGDGEQQGQEQEQQKEESDEGDPIFREENQDKISPQWSVEKMVKMSQGCVLKANRVIDPSIPARMIPFYRLETVDASDSEITNDDTTHENQDRSGTSHCSAKSTAEDKTSVVGSTDVELDDTKGDEAISSDISEILTIQTFLPKDNDLYQTEDEEETRENESFVQESRFAALMLE
ncbi:3'-5' exoribonuclease 1 [Entomortierella parvispora]|uniref:3'-5' exoribonuclease 1 n=1 Tax=Entomortierella parvispora TaxID=205924 RepID=A0A9P3H5V3_9FUNG|nr:3'-5' exoribonuclease 1 [Entomortierella parvispora]